MIQEYETRAYICNVLGFHTRASTKLVRIACDLEENSISISKTSWDGSILTVDAKSFMDMLMLGVLFSDTVSIRVTGAKAEQIASDYKNFIENGIDEENLSANIINIFINEKIEDPMLLADTIHLSFGDQLLSVVKQISEDSRLEAYLNSLGKPHDNNIIILNQMLVGNDSYTVKAFSERIADRLITFNSINNANQNFDRVSFSDRLSNRIAKDIEGLIQ